MVFSVMPKKWVKAFDNSENIFLNMQTFITNSNNCKLVPKNCSFKVD